LKKWLIIASAIVLGIIPIIIVMRRSESEEILSQLKILANTVSVQRASVGLPLLARLEKFDSLLTQDCIIIIKAPKREVRSLERVKEIYVEVCRCAGEFKLRFRDIGVNIDENGLEARTTLTATVSGRAFEDEIEAKELLFKWVKDGRKWKIKRVEEKEILR